MYLLQTPTGSMKCLNPAFRNSTTSVLLVHQKKSGYRLSAGYADNQGPLAVAYDGNKQYNLRLNYDLANWQKE